MILFYYFYYMYDIQEPNRFIPYISLNALEVGFHIMKVTGKIKKQTLYNLVNSGSTYNFLKTFMALKL